MDTDTSLESGDQTAQTSSSPFVVGQLLDGKYEILSFLGKGGMGSVYRVKHVHLWVELALKALDTTRVGDVNSSRRFQNEGRAAFSLKHPCLVKVHDFGVLENGHPFLVMDLVKGKTLQDLIKERGRLSLSEIESIFVQLCFGLAYAHQQSVIHRDIKPANIMLVDGMALTDEGSIRVLDFGIAKIVNDDRGEMEALTATGEVFGSPLYMSPEQCAGGAIDQRSDVYSLGCVLFEALTGTPPLLGANPLRTMMLHASENPPSLKEAALGIDFPEALEHIVAKMLAKTPSDRYADLGMVAHEISQACSGKKYSPPGAVEPAAKDRVLRETSDHASGSTSIQLSPLHLTLMIASTAILSILGTICFVQSERVQKDNQKANLLHKNKDESKVKERLSQLPEDLDKERSKNLKASIAKMKSSFDQVVSIKPQIVVENGSKKQRIKFPDVEMGTVNYVEGAQQGTFPAKGTITIPISHLLHLNIRENNDPGILANSFVFDKIDPALFTGLIIHGSPDSIDTSFPSHPSILRRNETSGAAYILAVAKKWRNLNYLEFDDLTITEAMIKSIDSMPKLSGIKLGKLTYDSNFFAQQSIFNRLQCFGIECGNIDDALKAVSNSRTIEVLTIGHRAKYSTASIRGLSKNRNMRQLNFGPEKLTDEDVKAACNLPQIKVLAFSKEALTESQMREILKTWQPASPPSSATVPFVSFVPRH